MKTFLVWCPEMGEERDDAREFEAFDHQNAAHEWAENEDYSSAEYTIVGGRDTPVVYVAEGSNPPLIFMVFGEAVPHYYARAVGVEVEE